MANIDVLIVSGKETEGIMDRCYEAMPTVTNPALMSGHCGRGRNHKYSHYLGRNAQTQKPQKISRETSRADARKVDGDFARATSQEKLEALPGQGRRKFEEMTKKRDAEERTTRPLGGRPIFDTMGPKTKQPVKVRCGSAACTLVFARTALVHKHYEEATLSLLSADKQTRDALAIGPAFLT
ncbi:hypothetical protein FN846DRAFT_910764 [Sphaerosporella brunnea]|uniref:Uncharacterized protein n=1 Tax=Sphaerosporella brunnea TaxID=1250544 RepID=A0A5J5EMR0_9PEZI|nr:hypothetical protein FN846DRAFT_910764 [Sphaerosporella brunnea]